MHEDFWHARWSSNEIGFHLDAVNPYLLEYWPGLGLPRGSRVLVPLCGKSLDLRWLREQGYRVLGIELSRKAVEDFFAEQGLEYTRAEQGAFSCYRADGLELWCGDFFALQAADVADCQGLYDRAALIALPAPMRERYVQQLAAILPGACRGLLVTLDYPQEQMDGPPFAVPEAEVRERLAGAWQLERLLHADVLQQNQRFIQRGLTALHETVYRLRRR
ncbi:thiopurine S-methyltransferase [Pseudomonas sp. N040]|uniref:thiopurine S-methyltransferase n=1 Tax=Pseudomonas sp. N040 TaxID=2785325 RepID=UPI0018A2CA63|nr:thiopurine S-methyltransferase [Pseudomonas sp. N040]MBF7730828.1 thiopurine S-methyltransferase [Pseudomonas sp. N040]MBW7014471.1 thiopurine S-methyltransferase [Pseudomonas sp. N040]